MPLTETLPQTKHTTPGLTGDEWFPLAPNQRVIWFHELLNRETPTYNIGGYLNLSTAINPVRFSQAYQLLLEQHDALRTEIRLGPDGEPRQRFTSTATSQLQVINFSEAADPFAAARDWMQQAMDTRFHFDQPPYAIGALLQLSAKRSLFFMNCHHIIADGWSFSLIAKNICRLYDCLETGTDPGPARESYRSYVNEEIEYSRSSAQLKDVKYWQQKFQTVPPPALPARSSNKTAGAVASKAVLNLPRELYDSLEKISPDPKVTAFHAILTAIHSALSGHRGGPQMVVGTPLLNRTGPARRQTIGLFAGILPIIIESKAGATVRETIQQVAADLRESYRHRRFPLSDINRSAGLVSSGRAQLFDVTLSFERHDYETTIAGTPVTTVPLTNSVTPLPLGIFVREFTRREDVQIEFIYRTDCLSTPELEWLKQRIVLHLQIFLSNPGQLIADLPMLGEDERAHLSAWNSTSRNLTQGRSALELFELQVTAKASHLAVVDSEGNAWSYAKLNEQANRIATALLSQSPSSGTTIGVSLERGAHQIAAILGVMKAGCVYLPLGLQESHDRLAGILKDADVRMVITSSAARTSAAFGQIKVFTADELLGMCASEKLPQVAIGSPAYCIFTSGSTGQPKGVKLGNEGLASFALAMAQACHLTAGDHVLQFSTPTFDASIFEIFCTLCVGATLHIPPANAPLLPDSSLNRFLRERRMTHILLTPAVLATLPNEDLPDLKVVIPAGDTCTSDLVSRWQTGRRVINAYGPSETTVVTTTYECQPGESHPPIGRPLANVRTHVVNESGDELPIGAVGEIVVGGIGVGLGYINRLELNERAFVVLPGLGRVYRSGDVGRWRADGQLEHLGRKDRQVKIRGCLVAPAEVEAALRSHPEVRQAAVIAQGEAPMQWLAAYTVPAVRAESLRHHLSVRLPAFMMPARFVGMSDMPLTPHRKIDLTALPPANTTDESAIHNAPRDTVDKELQRIWGRVLGVNEPGIDDDFFALGGDSLKAAVLGNEIERELKVTLPMAMLIGQPTIRNVADALRLAAQGKAVEWPVVLPIRPTGTLPPFFCLPGANASGFYFHAIAQELPPDQPFYAMQIPGVEPGGVPLETIEELATFELRHIREVRPHGPYRLGGHSNGGIIAFEITRLLEAAGETVEHLAIFDTTLTDPRDRNPLDFFSEVADVGSLLDVFGWDRKLAETLPCDQDGRMTDEPAAVEFVRKLLTDNGMIPYNASPEYIARIVAVWRAAATAQANYRPIAPIKAPITLFLARTVPENVVRGEERLAGWGWEKWTLSKLRVEEVPGNHVNMLSPPFSREAGRRLRHALSNNQS